MFCYIGYGVPDARLTHLCHPDHHFDVEFWTIDKLPEFMLVQSKASGMPLPPAIIEGPFPATDTAAILRHSETHGMPAGYQRMPRHHYIYGERPAAPAPRRARGRTGQGQPRPGAARPPPRSPPRPGARRRPSRPRSLPATGGGEARAVGGGAQGRPGARGQLRGAPPGSRARAVEPLPRGTRPSRPSRRGPPGPPAWCDRVADAARGGPRSVAPPGAARPRGGPRDLGRAPRRRLCRAVDQCLVGGQPTGRVSELEVCPSRRPGSRACPCHRGSRCGACVIPMSRYAPTGPVRRGNRPASALRSSHAAVDRPLGRGGKTRAFRFDFWATPGKVSAPHTSDIASAPRGSRPRGNKTDRGLGRRLEASPTAGPQSRHLGPLAPRSCAISPGFRSIRKDLPLRHPAVRRDPRVTRAHRPRAAPLPRLIPGDTRLLQPLPPRTTP